MPVFNFTCPGCGEHVRKLLPHLTYDKFCPKCNTKLERTALGPTTRIVEVRDNGLMPKRVEQVQLPDSTKPDDSGTV